jgi:hypothetical protein
MRVLISRKPSDYAFISESIARFKLNPKVLAAPETTKSGGGHKIVEKYAWGHVVFTHRHGAGATFVVVFERSCQASIEECIGFVAEVGDEDAVVCHGDDRHGDACAFRDSCVAIKQTAAGLNLSVDDLLLACSVEEITGGRAEKVMAEAAKKAEVKVVVTKHPPKASSVEADAVLVVKAREFFYQVAEALGASPAAEDVPLSQLAAGQLYVRDRTDKSGYVGLYVHSDSWDDPVCVLRPVKREMAYHLKLPATLRQLKAADRDGVCNTFVSRSANEKSRLKVEVRMVGYLSLPSMVALVANLAREAVGGASA